MLERGRKVGANGDAPSIPRPLPSAPRTPTAIFRSLYCIAAQAQQRGVHVRSVWSSRARVGSGGRHVPRRRREAHVVPAVRHVQVANKMVVVDPQDRRLLEDPVLRLRLRVRARVQQLLLLLLLPLPGCLALIGYGRASARRRQLAKRGGHDVNCYAFVYES